MSLTKSNNAVQQVQEGTLLCLFIQPGAKKTEIQGLHGDRLKIRIAAPPVEGAANEELLRFLKDKLKTKNLELLRGHTSRQKDVLCQHLSISHVMERLELDTIR